MWSPRGALAARALTYSLIALSLGGCSCNSLFFQPQAQLLRTPAQIAPHPPLNFDDVQLKASDGTRLHAWLIKPAADIPVKGRLLFLHGNAENISTHLGSVYWLPEQGYEVLLLDYRGYGQSEGSPCISGVQLDIEAAMSWLLEREISENPTAEARESEVENSAGKGSEASEPRPLFVLGQSLGASLAAYAVASHPQWSLSGVILDAPFSGYRHIVRQKVAALWLTWPLQYPVSWLFNDDYSPNKLVDKISPRPLLVFSSSIDRVIPSADSRALFERAGEPKHWVDTQMPHIATFNKAEHRQQLLQFLAASSAR